MDDRDLERLARIVVNRAAERRETGSRRASTRRLPSDKAEYPKLLCLDQNKWIDLARAHYGREDGAPFKDALGAVRKGVASGKLVVPVTGANIDEATEHFDEGRRERLARFMVDLSENQCLVNHQIVLRWELRQAVLSLFVKRAAPLVRGSLLQPGMFAAQMGKVPSFETGNPELDALLSDAMHDPEIAVTSIVGAIDRATIQELRENEERTAAVIEGIRRVDAHLSREERRQLEMRNLLTKGTTATKLNAVLDDLGVDAAAFRFWLSEGTRFKDFTDAIPTIDVPTTLMLQRDRNPGHRTHPNDGKDFAFLKVAIPYANVVVTERSWGHFAAASGVADRYDTIVERDATRLPHLLETLGCT